MKPIIGWLAVLLLLPFLAVGYAGGIIISTVIMGMQSAYKHVNLFGEWLGSNSSPKE